MRVNTFGDSRRAVIDADISLISMPDHETHAYMAG